MSVSIKYFVHGTTNYNQEKLAAGWIEAQLSEKGIQRVNALKEKISNEEFDLAISSDLKRAIDSANILFGDKIEIKHDSRLRECHYGDLDGQPSENIIFENHINTPFPNGESLKDVEDRVKDFCNYLLEEYNGKRIAIVAHKAPQFVFQIISEEKTWEEAIDTDWRKTDSWQPGWEYTIDKT